MSDLIYIPEEHRYYGSMCLICKQIAWYKDKTKCLLHVQKPFKKLEIEAPLGPILGFGAFKHECGGPILTSRRRGKGRY